MPRHLRCGRISFFDPLQFTFYIHFWRAQLVSGNALCAFSFPNERGLPPRELTLRSFRLYRNKYFLWVGAGQIDDYNFQSRKGLLHCFMRLHLWTPFPHFGSKVWHEIVTKHFSTPNSHNTGQVHMVLGTWHANCKCESSMLCTEQQMFIGFANLHHVGPNPQQFLVADLCHFPPVSGDDGNKQVPSCQRPRERRAFGSFRFLTMSLLKTFFHLLFIVSSRGGLQLFQLFQWFFWVPEFNRACLWNHVGEANGRWRILAGVQTSPYLCGTWHILNLVAT